jgi:hypothetical protein
MSDAGRHVFSGMADDFLENYDELEFVGNDRKIAKES